MNLPTINASSVLLVWGLAIVIYCYCFWRYLVRLYLTKYRAFDVVFLVIFLALLLSRFTAALIQAATLQPVNATNSLFGNFYYPVLVFVPLLVYLFISTLIEKRKHWHEESEVLLIWGLLLVIPELLAEITANSLSIFQNLYWVYLLAWHLLLLGLLLLVVFSKYNLDKWFNTVLALCLYMVGYALIVTAGSDYLMEHKIVNLGVFVIFTLVCIFPFGAREKQGQLVVPS